MMSPGEAIRIGQVWLRPFGTFEPAEQAYMGFPTERVRDDFLEVMVDGALAVIWIRQKDGDKDWKGRFKGILRLEQRAVLAPDHSSTVGENQRNGNHSQYLHAVPVIQAWEADPTRRVMMKGVIPSLWSNHTRTIGQKSRKMPIDEIPNIMSRYIREVSVFNQLPVSPRPYETVWSLFR